MELLVIREEKMLMLWILLSRNASTNTKSFYHNSWEMKFILSTQGASQAPFFFQPTERAWMCFLDRGVMQHSFLTYMHFQDIQCTCKSTSPSPHPLIPSPPTPVRFRDGPPDDTREKRSAHACLPCFRREFACASPNRNYTRYQNKLDSGREIQKSKLHTQKISLEFHEHKVY